MIANVALGALAVCFSIFASVFVYPCNADDAQGDALELQISVPKNQFLQLEPIPVRIQIRNPTVGNLTVVPKLRLEHGLLAFTVTDPEGKERPYSPLVLENVEPEPRFFLKPMQILVHNEVLHYSADSGVVFERTGTYQIQLRLRDTPELISNKIQLKVVRPAGDDKAALQLVREAENGRVFTGVAGAVPVREKLEELVKKYPRSPFSQHARFRLADANIRGDRFDQGIELCNEILKLDPQFPLAAELDYLKAKAIHGKARAQFREVTKKYPDWLGSRTAEKVLAYQSDP